MIQLKDGTKVFDPRLGRLIYFDDRNRDFPIRATLQTSKPRSYTWRCKQVIDQKKNGACVGCGITHELIARPAEVKGLDFNYARNNIYWPAQKIDPWPGGSYPEANPFYEGTTILAGVKVAQSLGWFDSYRWAFGIDDLILGVGHNGPSVLGIAWLEGMIEPDNKGYIYAKGRVLGGHCLLCNSINIRKERFTLHNSWGKDWGINGECYISFEDMRKLLRMDGEAVFFIRRHSKRKK